MLMVELLARMPDLRRRIQRDHFSDAAGHCRDCHGARWPCEMYQLAIQADRLHAFRAPWPPPPYQSRGGPIPPPRIRRDPMPPPAPWSGSRSHPPLGGPASWPAQRVQHMPPAPARATPYPARAAPAWPSPPVNQAPPVPPPRSGPPAWQSWPSSWTPEVPVPRQGSYPSPGTGQTPRAGRDTGLGWDRDAPPRHSLGFPASSRTHPPEPRRELASVLDDVLRWSR
jgi:hypothetical protein